MMKPYFGQSSKRPFTKPPSLAYFSVIGTNNRFLLLNCLWSKSSLHQVREWNNLARFLQSCSLTKQVPLTLPTPFSSKFPCARVMHSPLSLRMCCAEAPGNHRDRWRLPHSELQVLLL